MKRIASFEEFDFKHNGSITVHVGIKPTVVSDEVAAHLVAVFGGRIIVDQETVSETEVPAVAEETSEDTVIPETDEPAVAETSEETFGPDA